MRDLSNRHIAPRHPSPSRRFSPLLLGMALLGVASCGGDDPGTTAPDPPVATTITVSQSTLSLTYLGQTTTLTAAVRDQFARDFNTTVTWSSDDAGVATVSSAGVVTAVANGSTTVRATAGSLSASASVTVEQVATRALVVSGDGQSATVGESLAEDIVARSLDDGGSPVPGASMTFTVDQGGGSVSVATTTTDSDALATTSWTLGTVSGQQQITAAITGAPTGWAPFTATGIAGPAAALVKSSGDNQTGIVGVELEEPVAVKITDQFGNGVTGGTVSFAVTAGGGSTSPAQASTAADGTAQTAWTMGSGLGTNTLSAQVTGLPAVSFTATAGAAQADLVVSELTTSPTNPTSIESVTVSATVTNAGYLATGAGFQVQLLVDGAAVGTNNVGALGIGASTTTTFSIGVLASGTHTLRAVADAGGAITEVDETNNAADETRSVPVTTLVSPGTPISSISGTEGQEQLFTLEIPGGTTGTMGVALSGGSGDVDLYVHYGDRPLTKEAYQCQSGSPETTESCTFNEAEPGVYHILLYAWADFTGTTMLVTTGGEVVPYNLELVFLSRGSSAVDSTFVTAANLWESIVRDDINGLDFTNSPLDAGSCFEQQPVVNDVIDDLRIFVNIITIDGPGGTLGQAGPCIVDGLSQLPVVGQMQFDEEDLERLQEDGDLLPVIIHEMGHVMGIGTRWDTDRFTLLANPSLPNNTGADTHFLGANAIAAFDEAGGSTSYTQGEKVPVENVAGEGSGDAHWRESVLEEELMTPFLSTGRTNPLSAISIQSLADIGYRVDVSKAQPYTQRYSAAPGAGDQGRVIDLRGDVSTGPLMVVGKDGVVRRIERR